jgi:hypothetical protein
VHNNTRVHLYDKDWHATYGNVIVVPGGSRDQTPVVDLMTKRVMVLIDIDSFKRTEQVPKTNIEGQLFLDVEFF